jgi:hypothetical protein
MISFLMQNVDISKCVTDITSIKNTDTKDDTTPLHMQIPIHYPFQLPINYLDRNKIHHLSDTVSSDLELTTSSYTSMYEFLLKPKHDFAKQMIFEWSKQYTTDIAFLKDTQLVLQDTKLYVERMKQLEYNLNCNTIMDIWKSTKEDPLFLEKYNFMEWEMLKYLNYSPAFLQSLSIINLLSPLTSILIPIIFLILPFLLLKIQGIPIQFTNYINVLKDIAKHHFIGKTLRSFDNFSATNFAYIFITIAFYFLQIYQNIVSFFRFYKNIKMINEHLLDMKKYIEYSTSSMNTFVFLHDDKPSYVEFCNEIKKHSIVLEELYKVLENIEPFQHNMSKFNHLGYMLKCYHDIHISNEYETALRYSFGFEGYINNILGIYENIESSFVCKSTFNTKKTTEIREQYYPPYMNKKHVKNSCKFNKNMIVTGVNASGKTTFLKTTLINIIFTQQFGFGFYKTCVLNPYTHIHSYLNIPDTSGRDSLFQAEARRCKEIIDIVRDADDESRHFCIFDELYSGTNPVEATKSAYAFLLYLSKYTNVDFILTTHYTSICNKITKEEKISNYQMDIQRTDDGKLKFTYKIKPGICVIQGAVEILKEMEYPNDILDYIEKYTDE